MDTQLASTTNTALSPRVAELLGRAADLAGQADALNTVKALESDWRAWVRWCESMGEAPALPVAVETFAAYLVAELDRGLKLSTLRRRVQSMARVHREAGCDSPTQSAAIKRMLRGAQREAALKGKGQPRRARALSSSMLAVALPSLSTRDRALVLVGLVTGLRGSELASLTWAQLRRTGAGYQVALGVTKTDQMGAGAVVGVPRGRGDACPCGALRDLAAETFGKGKRRDPDARVFGVSAKTITRLVKRVAELAGEDASEFSSHSLRAGLLTTAAERGVSLGAIMEQSRHRSADVAATYTRSAEIDRAPAPRAVVAALVEAVEAGAGTS